MASHLDRKRLVLLRLEHLLQALHPFCRRQVIEESHQSNKLLLHL